MSKIGIGVTTPDIKQNFLCMMSSRLDHLAISKDELTPAKVEPFKIELTNTEPSYEKPLRYNKKLMEFIDKEIQQLLEKGLIYKSKSSWAAKIIMAPKGESWRMCMNYVGINSKTCPDRYPLPNIEDLHTWLAGKKVFSIIDLLSGYW